MPIVNKTKRTAAIYNRGREVVKVYDHGNLAWQKSTSIPDYLCFTALEAGQFTLTIPAAVTATYLSYVEWSKDGRTWTHTDNTSEAVTIDVQVASGEKVYWRGSGNCMTATTTTAGRQSIFSSTARFDASGHLISLLTGDNLLEHLTNYNTDGVRNVTFARLFEGCDTIVNASDLVLPTFTSWHTYIFSNLFAGCTSLTTTPELTSTSMATSCYNCMFYGCTSLTATPTLPATNLADDCYYYMFRGCTNLVTATSLPATILARNCYHSMFVNCQSLETGFVLPATILANSSYYQMFYGCKNLNYVKCLATDISATNCLTNWLYGVSSTGTFIQAEGVEWPRGASGIPTGWVDVEKRTMPSGYKQVEYLLNPNLGAFNLQHVFDSANETIELQFVNTADGGQFLGTTNHAGYYGAIKVGKSGTANLSVQIGIGNATTNTSVIGMTADAPMTFRYEGNANGFKFYTNGTLQKSYTGGWDVQHTITSMYVYSNTDGNTAPSTYPTWFGKCPFIGLKVWDGNSDIIIDFVPCIRESDGLAGFYDFARTTFYYSDNGNDFAADEEI